MIPADASVLEVGCGEGDLLAALPNARRQGIDYLPETIARARARHPGIGFEVEDAIAPPADLPHRADAVICDRLCHSVLDVKTLLTGLKRRLAPEGRIYLTAFSYLWEIPVRLAELAGLKRPAPTANWLSDSDFRNLYDITGLEVVRFEDRLLLPADLPVVSTALNRYAVRAPLMKYGSLYRIYVLRDRGAMPPARRASVSVIVPTRNEAGNVAAAVARTPVMGSATELIFVEGHSTDDTWAAIQRTVQAYDGPLQLRAFQQTGKGKGDAVRLGFAHATGDALMILDADLTVPPEELPSFYEVLAGGHADFVQGTRLVYPMEPGAMRFFNKIGNVAFSELFTYLLQQPIKDTLCGTKVLWRKDYERLAAGRSYFGDFDPFGDFDLIFGAARLEPEDRRDPRALPRPHLRRDQHLALEARVPAAEDVGRGRPQDQVRVTGECRSPRSFRRARWRGSRSTGVPGTRTPRCASCTATGTGRWPPSCRRRGSARASSSARGPGSRGRSSPTSSSPTSCAPPGTIRR